MEERRLKRSTRERKVFVMDWLTVLCEAIEVKRGERDCDVIWASCEIMS